MASDSFVHLHLHTEYSLLDGAIRIKDLMKRAVAFEMSAVAITDHGNLFGAVEFFQTAKKSGIKPIIGCEVYMAPGSLHEKKATSARDASSHFTLLASDATGYQNLVKLVSIAHLDGYYYKPRIDKETLAQYAKGLIGLSGCLKGEIAQALANDQLAKAQQSIAEFRDILGAENFFLEMHNHGIEAQRKINAQLPQLAKEFQLGIVAANDVHFLERAHHEVHDVMICIGTGANVADEKRMHYTPELYFKSAAEMRALFSEHPEACDNTLRIAERCNFEMEFGVTKYPNFEPPTGKTQFQYLREIAQEGLAKRFGERANSEIAVSERFERELAVLEKAGYVNYFLIVWDFINWAKSRDIPVGPGRGSAAGSLVAFAMGITDIDPLRFDLLFERFLNPERVSPPDIDVDFCQNRRGEVIDYVRQKYGERAVSQIITFGTLGAKSVVRDVGRVLGWSYGDADRIAKMIPTELNITLNGHNEKDKETGETKHIDGAIDKNPDLKHAVETEPATKQLWEYASLLEGLKRNTGVHAAGVVISDRDLSDYIPLTRGNEGDVVSQYAMGPLGDLGMLKMDFLGLTTLTIIHDAQKLIRQKQLDFAISEIPLDDAKTFDLLNRAEIIGVFQLDGGMASWCSKFDFKSIDDIYALSALYRPGPMDMIPDYVKRKKGQTKIKYAHPLLEKVCADTYGIMIYQEQVMAAASVLAGYTLGGADLLRRAMGKKDKKKMAEEREKFVAGCKSVNDIDEKKANEIFDLLEKFAGYGFNKSHSAAYGWVSYQTAYLKANYPVEFMAAILSNAINNTDKIAIFVAECQRLGIEILPPDVNKSSLEFAPEMAVSGARAIRYGLAAIKNVGEAAVRATLEEREKNGAFTSLEDFCARVDSRKANKKTLESLVKCGAFDFLGVERASLFASVDHAINAAAATHRDRASGQVSLFDMLDEPAAPISSKMTVRVAPWPQREKLGYEKELLGFYVTGHPLDEFRATFESGKYIAISDLRNETTEDKSTVVVAGQFSSVDKKFTKKDSKPFAIAVLEDLSGQIEMMIWNDVFAKNAALIEAGNVVAITARLDKREESPRLVASEIKALKAIANHEPPLRLRLKLEETTEQDLLDIRNTLLQFPGARPLELDLVVSDGRKLRLKGGTEYRVNLTPELREKLGAWIVR